MLNMEMEGKEFKPFFYTIERSKVKEYCLATGETSPLFTDPEAARRQGYRDTPVPLTFYGAIDIWGSNESAWEVLEMVGIDVKRMLDLKKEFEYYFPLYPGDRVEVRMQVESLYESSIVDKAVFKSEYYLDGKLSCVGRLTVGNIK